MKNILLLGAGMSASTLIKYLLEHSTSENWQVHVVDQDLALVESKLAGHVGVAQDCIALGKHLITTSYISAEMKALDAKAKEAGIIIMNEIGVDPGIDHMSAMKIIHEIQAQDGKLLSFKSYCGGLIAPQSDTNGWHYKFTWNPRNVVLAGQGPAAVYQEENGIKYLPYQRLFQQTEIIEVPGYGAFEAYANRNSIAYLDTYGLKGLPTILRGTLRVPPFSKAWNVLIQLGLTEDTYNISGPEKLTPRKLLNQLKKNS